MLRPMKTRTATIALAAALAVAVTAPAAGAAPVKYAGKTKENTRISFAVSKGKLSRIKTYVPVACVSAQGGPPRIGQDVFQPPGRFAIGRTVKRRAMEQDTALAYWKVTKNYTVRTRRSGRRIKGEVAVNFSYTVIGILPKLFVCVGNAHFSVKPR
jgi:hypothetical protein